MLERHAPPLAEWLAARPDGRTLLLETVRAGVAAELAAQSPELVLSGDDLANPRLFAWIGGIRPDSTTLAQLVCSRQQADSVRMADAPFKWVLSLDPVLDAFVRRHITNGASLDIDMQPMRHDGAASAVSLLRAGCPRWHELLCRSLDSVLLFRHPDMPSFAALGLHGLIGLNTTRGTTTGSFLEGLVHQGSHVLLSEVTVERARFFAVSPDALLAEWIGPAAGVRSVHEALHGMFTAAATIEVLGQIDPAALATDRDRLERRGRMTMATERVRIDVETIGPIASRLFTSAGAECFDLCRHVAARHTEQASAPGQFDLGNQGEDFDVAIFLQRNAAGQQDLVRQP